MKLEQALVACCDLTAYVRYAKSVPESEIFTMLSGYYELVGDIVGGAGGKVIKFMGDAALIYYPENAVDAGVISLLKLQENGDKYLEDKGIVCRHHIRAHFGEIVIGELGVRNDKRLDILGSTVNAMFMLKATGFAITPEVFRKLSPETRKSFKKHTPPVTYIPSVQSHRD
ncbi:MAG: adenylate/guanylate cyclase domain-containing protein [Candidatus Methylacidiphilales bacterium]|nr:hypothetical protein [Candidatus Methylacidiphilales bacterium]